MQGAAVFRTGAGCYRDALLPIATARASPAVRDQRKETAMDPHPSTSSTREGRFVRRGMCLAAAAGLLALSACGPDQTQDPDEGDGAPPEGDGTPAATAQVQDAEIGRAHV